MNDRMSKFLDALSDLCGEHKMDLSITVANFDKGYLTAEVIINTERKQCP